MRIDKYLKLTRIIKRRTVAKVLLDEGKIKVNGKIAKPSTEIKINDVILLTLGSKIIEIEVLNCKENVNKAQSKETYKLLSENITTI